MRRTVCTHARVVVVSVLATSFFWIVLLSGQYAVGGGGPAVAPQQEDAELDLAAEPVVDAWEEIDRDALVREKMHHVFGVGECDFEMWFGHELRTIGADRNIDVVLLQLASIGAKHIDRETSSDLPGLLIRRLLHHPNRDLVSAVCWYSLMSSADSTWRVYVARTFLIRLESVSPEDVLAVINNFGIDGGPRAQRWDESDCERDMLELLGFALALYGHQVRLPEAQAEFAGFVQDIMRRNGGRPCEDFLTSTRVLARTLHRVLPD